MAQAIDRTASMSKRRDDGLVPTFLLNYGRAIDQREE
jgi:hypothetical protein